MHESREPGPVRDAAPAGADGGHYLSIVVPLRDEEDNVLPLATQVQAALAGAPWPWQLILVDDGSRDATRARIREAVAASPHHLSGVILRRGFGQTAAMQAGIDVARGSVIATLDGDLQNNPHDIVRMVRRLLDEDLDLMVGWRRVRRDGWLRRLPSRLGNRIIGLLTGVPLHDYGCTLKIYRAAVLRRVRLYGEMHRFIPSWMATVTSPERIREEEVSHFPRLHGRSKYGVSGLARSVRVLLDLLTMAFFVRFRASPGHFFGRIGLACGGAGLLVLAWLTWLKLGEGAAIAGRPLLLFGILLAVIGAQFVCTGILAEMLARTWFEAGGTPAYLVRETVGHVAGDMRVGDMRVGDVRVGDMRVGDMRAGSAHTGDARAGGLRPGEVRAGGTGAAAPSRRRPRAPRERS